MGDEIGDRLKKNLRRRTSASLLRKALTSGARLGAAADTGQPVEPEKAILRQYEGVTWPESLSFRQILEPAPLPSPFSPDILSWIKDADGDPLSGVRDLYRDAMMDSKGVNAELALRGTAFDSGSRLSGFVCWREYKDTDEEFDSLTVGMVNFGWVHGQGLTTIDIDMRAGPEKTADAMERLIHFHGLKKRPDLVRSGAIEYHYFFVNDFEEPVAVNGVPVAKNMVAGPLPDFALIDIGGFVIIWWGSRAGVVYCPEPKTDIQGNKRTYDAFRQFENLDDDTRPVRRPRTDQGAAPVRPSTVVGPTGKSGSRGVNTKAGISSTIRNVKGYKIIQGETTDPRSSWTADFQRRLRESIGRPPLRSSQDPVHAIADVRGLGLEDVVLAIGSVWRGSIDQSRLYAFSNAELFDVARFERIHSSRCVRPMQPFIIPLVFDLETLTLQPEPKSNEEDPPSQSFNEYWSTPQDPKEANLLGIVPQLKVVDHMVLAVAQLNGTGDVKLTFFDSSKGKESQDIIRRVARNIVRNSAWLLDTWPNFTEEEWRYPPPQTGETAGLHTILNAWAFMLDLPLSDSWGSESRRGFYLHARDLVNLALAGRLDARTIRAFFQRYGYAVFESFEAVAVREALQPAEQPLPMKTRCHGMTTRSLTLMLVAIHEIDPRPGDDPAQSIRRPRASKKRKAKTPGTRLAPSSGKQKTSNPPVPQPKPEGAPGVKAPRRVYVEGDTADDETWRTRMEAGLQHFRRQRYAAGGSNAAQIERSVNLLDEDVVLAIASLWEGLRQNGVEFAYGTANCFRGNRDAATVMEGMTVVLQPHPLIMPLLFVREYSSDTRAPTGTAKRGHNPIGHLILAVAERPSAASNDVRLIFMDSAPQPNARQTYRDSVQGLVRYSGWMGVDAAGHALPSNPRFTEEWRPCPLQEGGNTCGMSTIFNAWAYMLGIPVVPSGVRRKRAVNKGTRAYMATGLEIVNLAIAGLMDSGTIQAFMNYYGYSDHEDPNDPATDVLPVSTVRMTMHDLEEIVLQLRQFEMAAAVGGNHHQANIPGGPDRPLTILEESEGEEIPGIVNPPVPTGGSSAEEIRARDLATLMNFGHSLAEATTALEFYNGDVNAALDLLYDLQPIDATEQEQRPVFADDWMNDSGDGGTVE